MSSVKFFSRFFTVLQNTFKSSRTTLKSVLVLVLVFGLERIFEKDVFECPTRYYFTYGNLFLFGPAVCLFSLTLLLNNTFWDVITGCHLAHFRRGWVAKNVARIIFQALLPPGVWIVVALIQTQYYVCLQLGPKERAIQTALRTATNGSTPQQVKAKINEEYSRVKTESQILAWALFVSLIILAFVAVCIRRCCFMQAEGKLPDLEQYDKLEAESAAEEFKLQMEKRAENVGKNFVENLFEGKDEFESTKDECEEVQRVREIVLKKYPRSAGDLSKPHRVQSTKKTENQANGKPRMNLERTMNTEDKLEESANEMELMIRK